MTSKNSVAAQNRFVYYPDHLVCMPGPNRFWENVRTILTEPVFRGFVSGLLKEPLKMKPQGLSDESVGDFITRRFGAPIADNIVSAVMHGIYAGDIYQLSARSILPKQWKHEIVHESVLLGGISEALSSNPVVPIRDQILLEELKQRMPTKDGKASPGYEIIEEASKSSVFTFKQGIGELATRLEDALESKPNVTIRKNTPIESLRLVLQGNISKVSPGALLTFSRLTRASVCIDTGHLFRQEPQRGIHGSRLFSCYLYHIRQNPERSSPATRQPCCPREDTLCHSHGRESIFQ